MQLKRYRQWVISTIAVTLLAGCGGGEREDSAASAQNAAGGPAATEGRAKILDATSPPTISLTVVSLTKISETRVSRTVFDYTFRITVKNGAVAKTAMMATVVGAGRGTTVIDGSVLIGDIAANATIVPADTIILRHERSQAFNAAALNWIITEPINGIAVPPEPDPILNRASIVGVDSDNSGIRDDVDRLLARNLGLETDRLTKARSVAQTLQTMLALNSTNALEAHDTVLRCITDRQTLLALPAVERATLNTTERRSRYGDLVGGTTFDFGEC